MRIRDDLELSMLTEFGPDIAAAIGEAYDELNRFLCHMLGVDRTIEGTE